MKTKSILAVALVLISSVAFAINPIENEKGSTSSIQNVYVSKLKKHGNYLLSIVRKGNAPITINVFDANNELVHTEVRETEGDFAVLYDVQAIRGVSKFQITDNAGFSVEFKK